MAKAASKGASLGRRLVNVGVHALSGFGQRDPNKLVFGSWLGNKYADNPKYLAQYVLENRDDLSVVWIGRAPVGPQLPVHPRLRFVEYGSWQAARELMSAGVCFLDHGIGDVGQLSLLRGATVVNLGHGLTVKVMGSPSGPARLARVRQALARPYSADYFAAASEEHRQKLLAEWRSVGASEDNVLLCGQPRNDFLLGFAAEARAEEGRSRLVRELDLPRGRRWILYMPTFRDSGVPAFSFATLPAEPARRLRETLERYDAVILEKGHPADARRESGAVSQDSRVLDIGARAAVDTQELLGAADLLVTDYSGCFFDYLLLDRPIVHYAYDLEQYATRDRGLYYPLDEVAGGDVVQTHEDLVAALERSLDEPGSGFQRRAQVRGRMLSHELGTACEQVLRAVVDAR